MDWNLSVGDYSALFDDPVVAIAAGLTLLSVFILLIPLPHWQTQDAAPTPFEVDIPSQISSNYAWAIGLTSSDPEVHDGKIYPRCPADGRPLTSSPIIPATPADIDTAILRAGIAQRAWANTTFVQRRQFLVTLLQYVNTHQEEIVKACCLDSGKTKIDACFGEILVSVEKLQWTIKHGEKALSPSGRPTNLLMCYKSNKVTYEPMGVVAACFSWNYPFHSWISNVISPLFAGNAVVLKPSEQTCWSSLYFLDIVRGALRACGHSGDLVQNIICLPDTADYLTSHPELSHITFIGSKEVAYKVCASAAKALTPVCVELGGKDPCIVLDDITTIKSINDVSAIILRGVFQSAGQNCIGIERIIALPKVHDLLVTKLVSKIESLRLGSVTLQPHAIPDMGSMISPASFTRLEKLVLAAVAEGAVLHCGGRRYDHPDYPHGHYFQPTLLTNVSPEMEIAQTELFAPVALIFRADDAGHAVEIANGTSYGLGSSVFGHDQRTVQRIVRKLKAGMVSVNDFGSYYACSMPFGGSKGSGYGRFGGAEGLQSLCNVKSVCEEAGWANFLGIRTQIPPILQYPVQGDRGWLACKGIIETGYGIGIKARAAGLKKLLRGLLGPSGRT